jgi:type II restriction enzyme
MAKNKQSTRLVQQHKQSHGVVGIFGNEAKLHDAEVSRVAKSVLDFLAGKYPKLEFRLRSSISKTEINEALQKIDKELGQTLFVSQSSVKH